jgi:hypothetical protein
LLLAFAPSACRGDDRCGARLSPCALLGDAGTLCADTQSSFSHCGACFRHCAVGQRCVAGRCVLLVCDEGRADCADRYTRRECSRDGRSFVTFECPVDTVCARGQCRTWPDESAFEPVEHETFEQPLDLPDWLVTPGMCGRVETTSADASDAARLARFTGPLYARRALRFGEGDVSAASVRLRALGAANAELALFATAGSASAGVAGGVRVRVEGAALRVYLANGALAHERPADRQPFTLRVEQDRARDRLRVLVDGRVAREATLSTFILIGSHLQVQSSAPCGQPTFELEDIRTWSAP